MARVLGKYREAQRWTPDPSRPISESEQNWDRIGFGERPLSALRSELRPRCGLEHRLHNLDRGARLGEGLRRAE
jgi:hypothetical protein